MADNVVLDAGAGGAIVAGAELSISGDTAVVQFVGCGILAGSEGSWTFTHFVGGAGAVAAGVQRVTLASDDPAVASLSVMDDWDDGSDRARVVGAAAHDAASAGNPMLNGAYAKAAAPTDVSADGDAVNLWALRNGALCINVTAAGALIAGDATNGLDVDVTRSALPSGASTAAKQPALGTAGTASTDVITVQGIAAMTPLLVTLSGTNNIATVTTVTTVSTVTAVTSITNALPAGTNAIGKLAANSGVDIGDVDVTSIIPGTGATNLGKAIDTATGATDTGVLSLATRDDALSALTPVEGDNVQLRVDANGALWITVSGTVTVGSHAVTNAGTFAVQTAGDVAHDSADSGSPVKVGFKAESSPKGITLVADADRTDGYADLDGIQIVKLNTSGADAISEAVSNTDGASTAFTNFGAVANTKNAVTCITVFRTDSGTSMAYIDFRDGTAGAVLFRVPLPPAGGAVISLAGQPIFKTSANTALAFDVSSALTTVYISISGFQTKC